VTSSHATEADLVAYLPADALGGGDTTRLLERASRRIDKACRAPYSAHPTTGLATDASIAAALRDATCAQIEFWLEVGESGDVDGLDSTEYSVPGYSGTRSPRLAPRALDELEQAGLTLVGGSSRTRWFGWPW